MSVQATAVMYSSATLSDFQTWAGAIDSAIAALGWVVTTDTGQTAPASFSSFVAGTASYYRIYKAADALQATLPMFLRIDYKCNASGGPSMKFQMGTGTDGAGNLTGNVSTAFTHSGTTSVVNTTTYQCYFSGTPGRLSMALWATAVSAKAMGFSVERSHDLNGADTGEYFFWHALYSSGTYAQQTVMLPATGGVSTMETLGLTFVKPSVSTFLSSIFFSPIFPGLGNYGNPSYSGYMKGTDITNLGTITPTIYGSAHTLLTISGAPFGYVDNTGGSAWCMRYE